MATWDQVRDYIGSSYTVQKDDGDALLLVFGTMEDRSQMVLIQKRGNQSITTVQISSPIGTISTANLNAALEALDDMLCGGMVKIGDRHWVRQVMPIDDLQVSELEKVLMAITLGADELEKRFVGGDAH